MAHDAFTWRCDCGTVTASIAAGASSRAVCYCKDCQAFARTLGKESILTASGGTDLIQTLPEQVTITSGIDHVACLRLKESGGIYRWYAGCCDTPMLNTGGTPKIPLASFLMSGVDPVSATGPIIAHVNTEGATGPVPNEGGGMFSLILSFAMRGIPARISGRWRQNPFFGDDGRAIVTPRRLTPEEREAAYRA